MNSKTASFVLMALAGSVLSSGSAARPVCDEQRVVDDVRLVQTGESFAPYSVRDTTRRSIGEAVKGRLNSTAQFGDGTSIPPVASYQDASGALHFAVWWKRNHAPVIERGNLVQVTSGGDRTLVRFIADSASAPSTATDRIYDSRGAHLAERQVRWNSEDSSRPALSATGDVLYDRPSPGLSELTEIVLLDPTTFAEINRIALDGVTITDVLVVDKQNVFFTAGGGVFRSDGSSIASVGTEDAKMRHEELQLDRTGKRILSRGPGGFAVLDLRGNRLGGKDGGPRFSSIRGFTEDGLVWENATAKSPLRTLDALSGEVVSEYDLGDPLKKSSAKVSCVFAHSLVLTDADGQSRVVDLRGKP